MAEKPKVVSLRGEKILAPFQPRPAVIEFLEGALEKARAGEIIGVAAAFEHGDGTTSGSTPGQVSRQLLGMVEMLKADLCDAMRKED